MIGKKISHYHILEELGRGGMGIVYKAEDTKLKRTVALKFLSPELTRDPEAKKRFMNEAQAASALEHSNICTIYEIDETEEEQMFIAMACYQGEILKDKIKKGPFKIDDAIDIAIQSVEGLSKAHQKGIIHRDVKPGNVLITEDGVVKIIDFGLAKLAGRTKLTKTGTTLGTVAYMSPEQTRGDTVDHRSDIWSLGVILFEMITGQIPFKGEYDQAMIYSIVNDEPAPVTGVRTGVPMELERIISKTMAKNPEERYQHLDELLVDLRHLQIEKGEVPKASQSKFSPKKRKKVIFISTAVTAIVLVTSIVFITQKQKSKFIANRIIVVPFENKTGDASLDMLGQMAAEMITQGMSKINELEAVPFISVMDSYSRTQERPTAFKIAEQNEAGVLITGSYYLQGEYLLFRASIMDAEHAKILEAPSPAKGLFTTQEAVIGNLCSQILGALAFHFQFDVQTGQTYIPSFEAYKEYRIGFELFGIDDERARHHLYKSVEIDSAFTIPMLRIAVSYSNQGQYARADSLFDILNQRREALPLLDRTMLDYFIAARNGNLAKAMRIIRKAEALAPRNYEIKYCIGYCAISQNLPRIAVDTYTELGYERLTEEIRGHWGFMSLVAALYMIGEYEQALEVIHFSRQHFPDQVSNLRCEAILQAALGQIREVNGIIDESYQLSGLAPGGVMLDAAKALRAHGHRESAHDVLVRTLEWFHSRISGDFRFSIAQALYIDEQWTEAHMYFERLHQEYPGDQDCQGYVGVVAARLGDREKANGILEALYSKHEQYLYGSHLYWCARIAAVLGDRQRAVDLLREAYGLGRGYDMYQLLEMDFESLRNYEPYIELIRPKG